MAVRPLLSRLLIWASLSTTATSLAYSLDLADELTSFVPVCAQDCLEDFITLNYPQAACGSSPSLRCLCTEQSLTGFTLGEGAALCVGGARTARICNETEARDAVVNNAYNMCTHVPSALPITHEGLSATVVVPSTGTGSIILSTPESAPSSSTTTSQNSLTTIMPPPSTATSTEASSSPTTTARSTTTADSTTTTPPSRTPTSLITSTRSATQSTTTPSQPAETSQEASPVALGTAGIVGITVGIVGAVALALGGIFLARHFRKKNFPDLDDESFATDVKKRDSPGPRQSRITSIFHISPPVFRFSRPLESRQPSAPPSYQSPPPPNNNGGGHDTTIGLAISRPRSEITAPRMMMTTPRAEEVAATPAPTPLLERKRSRLLPAKPNLTLTIPPQAAADGPRSQGAPPTTDRASTMTNMTAFADLDTEAPEGGQIWRPPPTDPQSATTYYVADRWGNWVLGTNDNRRSVVERVVADSMAELDTYTPLTKSPIERQEEEAAAAMAGAISAASTAAGYRYPPPPQKPQPAFLATDPVGGGGGGMSVSRSSSVYSQASAVRPPRPPPPPAAARRSSSGSSRKAAAAAAKAAAGGGGGGGVKRSDSNDSYASVTTINTSSSGILEDEHQDHLPARRTESNNHNTTSNSYSDIARLSQLSPVVESPSPITSNSRMRGAGNFPYNKFSGRLDGATIRLVPPPKRPNFASSPPGQPSPTLGTVLPAVSATGSPSAYPPPLRPSRPYRGPTTLVPAQSPGSGFSPDASPEPSFRRPQPQQTQQRPLPQRPQPQPQPQPQQQQQPPRPLPRTPTPPQQWQQPVQTRQQQPPAPSPHWQPQQLKQGQQGQQGQRQLTPPLRQQPPAPRLDTSQAAASGRQSPHVTSQVTIASPLSATTATTSTSTASSLLAKRVGNDKAAALALDPTGKPRAGGPWQREQQGGGGQAGGLLSPETAGLASPRGPGSGTLPMTPTWQPKLTPTRRGDDLFLSVQ